ncbi:primosomal protein N' [Patescibacteria group bacterium]
MQLAHVIPIAKNFGKETLTYFTAKDIEPGWIVSVPVRKKIINALVVATEDASISKTDLRSKGYALKKIEGVKSKDFFLPEFITGIEKTAEYFASNTGVVLNTLTPKAVQDFDPKLLPKNRLPQKTTRDENNTKQEVLLLQAGDEERFSTYKNIIREEFAKHSSVFFCVPEISEIEKAVEILQKGIEEHVFVFHSKMTKKAIIENWKKVISHDHPVFIIATGQYLSIPRSDIDTIIVEKEHSDSYKMLVRPFVDIRSFAKIFAQEAGRRLILGDMFLRPETIHRRDDGEYTELSPLKFRSISATQSFIIDMKPSKDEEDAQKSAFAVVSPELKELIKTLPKYNERMFILASRKGLSPLTVCSDCGTIVTCKKCTAPLVLHKELRGGKSMRTYACHKCSHKQDAIDRCESCSGWRLQTLGVGIEQAEEEILKECPKTPVLRIDAENAKTAKKIKGLLDTFYSTPGAVLLGTEIVAPYLDREIENIAILSVDSLLTIPDFSMNEKVFNTLLRMHAKAGERFLIQTRDAKNEIFIRAAKGNLMDFYRDEISQRETLSYPPFSILIKISREGEKGAVVKDMEKLSQVLEKYNPNTYPAFIDTIKGKYRMNALIKIKMNDWPDKKLSNLLAALPQTFTVNVEPRDVL